MVTNSPMVLPGYIGAKNRAVSFTSPSASAAPTPPPQASRSELLAWMLKQPPPPTPKSWGEGLANMVGSGFDAWGEKKALEAKSAEDQARAREMANVLFPEGDPRREQFTSLVSSGISPDAFAGELASRMFPKPVDPIKLGQGDTLLDPVTRQPIYTAPTTGDATKPPPGYRWNDKGDLEAIPGGPASGGRTANAPPGYRWSGPDGTTLETIPGGPAEKLPAELAARQGMAEEFLRQLPGLKADIAGGAATGPVDSVVGDIGWGRSGELHRRIQSGSDALLRNLTGAGMSIPEAERYVKRYEPRWSDTALVLTDKVNQLEKELRSVLAATMRSRGKPDLPPTSGQPGTAEAPAAASATPNQIQSDADYDALPSGTEFIDPEGVRRRKP